ncbi:uncharacterized protein LOC129764921 [Toxorhynchites rutilus septentrionalis]|uniref:uncharacterized protein LOC129764921 n=1 Tax=Toxorhynchites rutilus septentrionalis TaxID=329112 RepID=UPI00247A1693|nr:uncharacterized protein LOC129764921 [Toxorhynchites rutilus septentrionalis]
MTPRPVWFPVAYSLVFIHIVTTVPQNYQYYQHWNVPQEGRHVIGKSTSDNLIQKDFFIHEIPMEVFEDEINDQIVLMTERKHRQHTEMDNYLRKLIQELNKLGYEATYKTYRE